MAKPSQVRIDALRTIIDAKTRDYIEALLSQNSAEQAHAIQSLTQRIDGLTADLSRAHSEIAALKNTIRPDDRYALTKAGLARRLKAERKTKQASPTNQGNPT